MHSEGIMQEAYILIFNLKRRKMKKVLIKVTATIFIFLFSGMMANIYSEEWIDKVIVDKKFDVKFDAKLIIDHEYGKVRCKNWDQNTIAVKVTVRVKTDDSKIAEKIINKIIVDVDGSTNKVEALCDLNQRLNGNKGFQVSIDFDIYMPRTINLQLNQKFGSTYIQSISGSSDISVEYGSLEIGDLSSDENQLDIEFSEANITNISSGEIEISYSKFNLHSADNISVKSDYSDISFDTASIISLEQEGGNANIGEVGTLNVETDFSNLVVNNLRTSIIAATEYGNLSIMNVKKDFSTITIDNEYGGVIVMVNEDANYVLDAKGEYGSITYPEKLSDVSYKKVSQSETIIKATVGDGANPKSTITINNEYGSVDISVKK